MAAVGQLEEQAARDPMGLGRHLLGEGGVERLGAGLEAAPRQLAVELGGHLVHPELDDRDVGERRLEILGQRRRRHQQLRLRERLEVAPGVDQEQVALVAEQLDERRLALVGGELERARRLGREAHAGRRRQGAKRRPAQAEALVQQAPAVERGRDDGTGHDFRRSISPRRSFR